MKKLIVFICAALGFSFVCLANVNADDAVIRIAGLSQIKVGEETQLRACIANSGPLLLATSNTEASDEDCVCREDETDITNDVTWVNNTPDLISLSESGVATGIKKGLARVGAYDDFSGASSDIDHSIDVIDDENVSPTHGETYRLFVVDKNITDVSMQGNKKLPEIENLINLGDKIQLKAIVCKDSDALVEGTSLYWEVSDCQAVNASWTITGEGAISVDGTGLLKTIRYGHSWDEVTATVPRGAFTLDANDEYDSAHNSVMYYVQGSEAKKGSTTEKTIYKDGNTFKEDVVTSGNPRTGLKSNWLLLTSPIAALSGAYAIYRKVRPVKEEDTLIY